MNETVLTACLNATNDIWDDREAYIMAVLERLGIDPMMPWTEYATPCTCGYGGLHEPANPRCQRNQVNEMRAGGEL